MIYDYSDYIIPCWFATSKQFPVQIPSPSQSSDMTSSGTFDVTRMELWRKEMLRRSIDFQTTFGLKIQDEAIVRIR